MSRADLVPCQKCNGSGQIDQVVGYREDGSPVIVPQACSSCGGSGRV